MNLKLKLLLKLYYLMKIYKVENKIYTQETTILIDTFKEVQAQNKVYYQTIKHY